MNGVQTMTLSQLRAGDGAVISGFLSDDPALRRFREMGLLSGTAKPRYTFSGISWLRPEILTSYPRARERYGLGEVFVHNEDLMQAELYRGDWCDVGTPERLQKLEARLLHFRKARKIAGERRDPELGR